MQDHPPEGAGRAPRVLVVDDDHVARLLASTTLQTSGFEVIEATSGDHALRLLANERVDAVLLDRMMPDLNGVEVLHWIRRTPTTATTPVLLVTALDGVDSLVEGLGLGADDYIVKPFEPDELVARLRSRLRGRAEWNEIVTKEVERRVALVGAAQAASATTSLEQGALELCDGLLRMPATRGAAFVELTPDGISVLAIKGDDPLEALRSEWGRRLVRHLADRADEGAWIAPVGHPSPGSVVTVAPVRADDVVVGLILASPDVDAPRNAVDRLHAAAIDFAALAGGVFGTALLVSARRQSARRDFLRMADAREFSIVFQPVVRLSDESVVGYEALARFDNGEPPEQVFLDAAGVGAGHALELAALEAAVESFPAFPDDVWLSINVSPSVIVEEDIAGRLEPAGTRPIVLELSELEPVDDYGELHRALSGLGTNVVLSVDDAGSGFASLAHILALGAKFVKLDQSWVREIDRDPAKRALVAGIQNFAVETDAVVIAEGIETMAELDTIRPLGIELGQGFLLGRPRAGN